MNRRSVVAAACALACFFGADWWLYSRLGFLRTFGQATQEGQIVSKVARAAGMAAQADVIAFGSSYIRSGLSGQPFFDRGLLLWNFGISGAGPLTEYFALKHIAGVLAGRAVKPILLFELKADAIERRDDTLWAEYSQYLGIVRTRTERLSESPLLFGLFHEMGMTSQYITSVAVPSAIYRSYNVQLIQREGQLDGYFFGMEDATGYAPLYTFAADAMFHQTPTRPLSNGRWLEGKVAAIRRFLTLARALSCPVVLYASPTWELGGDAHMYDELRAVLAREFPDVLLLRTDEYPLGRGDLDGGTHPNLRGSDKLSRFLIERLQLKSGSIDEKIRAAFDVYDIATPASWSLSGARVSAAGDGARAIVLDGSAPVAQGQVAKSPPMPVRPDRECVFELGTALSRGRLMVKLAWQNSRTGLIESTETVTPVELPDYGATARVFLRGTPHAGEAWLEISDYGALTGGQAAVGRLEALRFWSNRP